MNRCDTYYERMSLFDHEPPINSQSMVMLGDSLTCFGGNWNERLLHLPEGPFVNRGIAGDDTDGIRARLTQVIPGQPKGIIFLAGINDISHQVAPEAVVEGIRCICQEIKTECSQTSLLLQTLLPINEDFHQWRLLEGKSHDIVQVNEGLRRMATEAHLDLLDLYPYFLDGQGVNLKTDLTIDGLHLNEEGYKVWTDLLRQALHLQVCDN